MFLSFSDKAPFGKKKKRRVREIIGSVSSEFFQKACSRVFLCKSVCTALSETRLGTALAAPVLNTERCIFPLIPALCLIPRGEPD